MNMMGTMNPNETAKIIRDLLRIAKVAMPTNLYADDPRVLAGVALVRNIERGERAARPPSVTSRLQSFDLTELSRKTAVEMSNEGVRFVTTLPWDVSDALIESRADDLVPFDIADAVTFVLRDWLVGHGAIEAQSEEAH
jgi:hypothetical protein